MLPFRPTPVPEELERVIEAWEKLTPRVRDAILVLAGVVKVVPYGTLPHSKRTVRGETPSWLLNALTMLKDSKGYLSDREIAKRLGVSSSTLSRNSEYRHARKTYLQPIKTVVRKGIQRRK
ncbi:MAG TPA: HTH domain-containing protein [Planctomycetota bacterium]|nr:HTH domain-containing protein [Planctomycetota bacterium]